MAQTNGNRSGGSRRATPRTGGRPAPRGGRPSARSASPARAARSSRPSRRGRLAGWLLLAVLVAACVVAYDRALNGRLTVVERGRQEAVRLGRRVADLVEPVVRPAEQVRRADTPDGQPRPAAVSEPAETASAEGAVRPAATGALELPAFGEDAVIVCHREGRYTLCYDVRWRQASWVAYVLTRTDATTEAAERRDRFVPDPQVVAAGYPTAVTDDYRNSGYDRGHLCPSADRRGSQRENDCTFYLSNIAPQTPALNRGEWRRLEEQVRRWAERYDTLYVVTGGIMSPAPDTLRGGVGIPDYFYKALLAPDGEGGYRAAAYVLPNAAHLTGGYADYAVTVDSLEARTGMDFFCDLPDSVETAAERVFVSDFWR